MALKKFVFLAIIATAFSVSGCGIAYQNERDEILKNTTLNDFGTPPPDNWKDIAKAFISNQLKDPESGRFEFGVPNKDAIQQDFGSPHAMPVWTTTITVNAKNSFGGYTGSQPWSLAWKNGKIIAQAPPYAGRYGARPGAWRYLQQ